jgi:hypothetical protein
VPKTDEKGNKLVNDDGWYINASEKDMVGNAMPKFIGGFINQFSYKQFFLDVLIDYSYGGKLYNEMYQYGMAQGLTPASLQYRSAETGGLAYYFPDNDNGKNALPAGGASGPNGEYVYHNGYIQEGIVESTGMPNQQIVPIDRLTNSTYNWGTAGTQMTTMHSIFDKSYIKMRELAFGYTFPKSISTKFRCNNLQLSVFGRNLFYIYKAMPDWDAESSIGTNWVDQARIGGSTASTRSFGMSLRASF